MAVIRQGELFNWKDVEVASDLDRLRLVIDAISLVDEELMQSLEALRGKGQNKFPVRCTWHAVLAGIVFGHTSVASLRREMQRNAELRSVCGFDALRGASATPSKDGFRNFLCNLMQQEALLAKMFHSLVERIRKHLPDLGAKLAVDSKAIPSFGKPVKDTARLTCKDGRRDTDADCPSRRLLCSLLRMNRMSFFSRHPEEPTGRLEGHLLVDSVYELPLAFSVDVASSADMNNLLPLVENLEQQHPEIHQEAEECSADKGYDSAANNALLFDLHDIKPVIDTRKLWKNKTQETLFSNRYDVFTYDEKGQVYCTCPSDQRGKTETRELAFAGFEKARGTLKYRCPAAAYGFNCSGREECESLAPGSIGMYGRVVRVPLKTNQRIFTPVARHTFKWEKAYRKRSAVERVNGRIDQVFGFEQHTIRGKQKMTMRLSLALIVMLAMALGRIQIGQKDQMRSMLQPIVPAA